MSAFTSAFGSAVGGGLGRSLFGGSSSRNIGKGFREENKYYHRREAEDWRLAQERGLTPQEYYGSPASGGSGPSGSAATTLGNAASQKEMQGGQLMAEATQRDLDRKTSLQQTKMQTDASIKSSAIAAGASIESSTLGAEASIYGSNTQRRIAKNQLALSTREFNEVTVPEAAQKIKKSIQETKKLLEETATSTPAFQRSKILLTMGVENTIQTALLQRFGIDITSKKSMQSITTEQFRNILSVLVAVGSHANRELQGLGAAATGLLDALNPFSGEATQQYNLNPIR